MFKAVLLGNTLQFRVIAEIFQGGFVVFQQQFSKVHFEAATTHNAHHHDVGGFTAESEGPEPASRADADVQRGRTGCIPDLHHLSV